LDRETILEYFERKYRSLLKLAVMMVKNTDAAQDVLHDVAVVLLTKQRELEDVEDNAGFLAVCIRRTVLNYFRKNARCDVQDPVILAEICMYPESSVCYDYIEWVISLDKHLSKWRESNSYPEFFAGACFHNDTEFIVKTTSTDADVVKEVKALFGEASTVELAKYSYVELLEKRAQVDQEIKNKGLEVRTSINMKANTVEVQIAKDTRGKNVASQDFLSKFSSEPFSISYVENFLVEPTASIGNNTGCYYTATAHTSSLGCWIIKSGVYMILCAGHSPNGVTGSSSLVYTSSSKTTKIGYVGFAQYNPSVTTAGDFGYILPESSHTPASGNQSVSGFYTSDIIPDDTYVYRSGKTSASSGYVLQTGIPITYIGDTGSRTDMVEADYTTTVGESGNAVVAGSNLLIGIQGGGTGPSYFTPWWLIISYI
jgi:hypothetical protein